MSFDNKELNYYRKEMQEALKSFAEKNGLQVEVGHITYSDHTFTAKVNVVKAANKGEAERLEFEQSAEAFAYEGITKDHYGREIKLAGKTYKLVGLKAKSPKFPLLVEDSTGKRYKVKLDRRMKEQLGLKIHEWDE